LMGLICQYLGFLFVALGIIGDALNVKLGLESMSWFLLAIVAGLNAIIGHTHTVGAKHLLGMEAESKKGIFFLIKQRPPRVDLEDSHQFYQSHFF